MALRCWPAQWALSPGTWHPGQELWQVSPQTLWAGMAALGWGVKAARDWGAIAQQLQQKFRRSGRNAGAALLAWSWCKLWESYSPFAFYPSVISVLAGAIKRPAWSYGAIDAET